MKLLHVALVRTSETASDRFFCGLLGLERRREKVAGAELCRAIFGVGREHRMIDYANDQMHFEIFLVPPGEGGPGPLTHVCLEVDDAAELVGRCAAAGVEVRVAPRGDGRVVFLADGDGNLYEIKQRAAKR